MNKLLNQSWTMTHVTYKERSELRKTTLDFVSQPLEYFLNLLQNNTIYTIDSSTLLSKIYKKMYRDTVSHTS